MPRKVFQPAELLGFSDVNTFLMDQSVMVFDDAAARTTAIPSPIEGMVTYVKDLDLVQVWDGSEWDEVSGGGSITVSSTAPGDPDEGDLWFDDVSGSTFVYYTDSDSSQWVEVGAGSGPTAAAVSTSAPASAEQGQLWFDSELGNLYFYYVDVDGGQWVQVRSAAPAAGDLDDLGDVAISSPSSGEVLQFDGTDWVNAAGGGLVAVKSALKTDAESFTNVAGGDNVAVTDLSITHEVSDPANKLIISAFFGAAGNSNDSGSVGIAVHDGSGLLAVGDSAGSRTSLSAGGAVTAASGTGDTVVSMPSVTFVYTPGSGSKTYTVRAVNINNANRTLYINRSEDDSNGGARPRSASSLVIQEVAV